MDTQQIIDYVAKLVPEYSLRLIVGILIWIIGSRVIKMLSFKLNAILEKRKTEESLRRFLNSLVSVLLKIVLIISILGTLGVKMTSFVAILASMGLAIGMALSGTLQNFAGGIILLTFKPFKIGDLLEAQGHKGTVKEIQLFNTILKTPDNKTVILPNGRLSNASMVNFSTEEKRRVDWVFGIGYGDDIDLAEKIIRKLCDGDDRILKDPKVFIVISELGDSSVNFTVRAWVYSADYWGVFFDTNKKVYKAFMKEGINIPFPQMDVHLHKED